MAFGITIKNKDNLTTIEDKFETQKVMAVGWVQVYWIDNGTTSPSSTTGLVNLPSGMTRSNTLVWCGVQNARNQGNVSEYKFGIHWKSNTQFQVVAPYAQTAFPNSADVHIRYALCKIGDNSDASDGGMGLRLLTSTGGVAFRGDRTYMNTETIIKNIASGSGDLSLTFHNNYSAGYSLTHYLRQSHEIAVEGYWFLMNDTSRISAIWDSGLVTANLQDTGKITFHPFVSIDFRDPIDPYGSMASFYPNQRYNKQSPNTSSSSVQYLKTGLARQRGTVIGVLR